MDERRRRELRAFEAAPEEGAALELVAGAVRAGDDEGFAAGLRYLADLSRWDALARETRRALGPLIAARVPGLRFARLHHHFLGEASHEVLIFERDEDPAWLEAVAARSGDRASTVLRDPALPPEVGWVQEFVCLRDWNRPPPRAWAEYVLVPGGVVSLGWEGDLARAFRRWGPSVDELLHQAWVERARRRIRPRERVALSPFLLERHPPTRDGADYLDAATPPEAPAHLAHAAIVAALAREGARLPTNDEFEHACDAGAGTLFRWGDLWPTRGPRETAFDGHLVPNAFGVLYGLSVELTADPRRIKNPTGAVPAEADGISGDWSAAITAAVVTAPVNAVARTYARGLVRRVLDVV